jgi:two-component system C4-dicarboxylate transport response regulator DctD
MFHQGSVSTENNAPSVLIVEDEQIARRALTSLLAASGFTPQACASAEEALEKFEAGSRPSAVLVDVDLPGMSGLELVSRLEEINPGVITVLITAAEGDRIERFRRDHDVHYLRKPLNFKRLLCLLPQ